MRRATATSPTEADGPTASEDGSESETSEDEAEVDPPDLVRDEATVKLGDLEERLSVEVRPHKPGESANVHLTLLPPASLRCSRSLSSAC